MNAMIDEPTNDQNVAGGPQNGDEPQAPAAPEGSDQGQGDGSETPAPQTPASE